MLCESEDSHSQVGQSHIHIRDRQYEVAHMLEERGYSWVEQEFAEEPVAETSAA